MGKLLRKYLGIYFMSLISIMLLILSVYAVTDITDKLSRLKNQDFYSKSDGEHILKVYVMNNVWCEDETEQQQILTEVKKGERYRVGDPVTKVNRDGYIDFVAVRNGVMSFAFNSNGVFAADYDGKMTATFSLNLGMYCSAPRDGNLFGKKLVSCPVYENDREENSYMSRRGMRIRVDTIIRYNVLIEDILLLDRRYHNRKVSPTLSDTYTNIWRNENVDERFYSIFRNATESTVILRAYDNIDEDVIIAQAEVRIYYYSNWRVSASGSEYDASVPNSILAEMGINDENNIMHVDVELVDYWQVERY